MRTRMAVERALAAFAVIWASACGSPTAAPPPPPLTAVPELRGLRLFLDPNVAFTAQEKDCAEYKDAWSGQALQHLSVALSKIGFDIVAEAKAPRDVSAKLAVTATGCTSFGQWFGGRMRVELQPGAPATVSWVHAQSSGPSEEDVAKLIRLLVEMPQVLALGKLAPRPPGDTPAGPAAAPANPHPAARVPLPTFTRGAPQPTAYAVVIGVERYRDLPAPPGARADAEAFAALLESTLGVPKANIHVALDDRATRSDIERHLVWLTANVPANGRAYFFFSGHGAPDAARGTAMLLPFDGDAEALDATAVRLDRVLSSLAETKGKEALAFVDACFSGAGGRSILPKGARPLVKLGDTAAPASVALFAAAAGAQISGPSQEGNRGAFTKYLLQGVGEAKADIDGDGQLTLDELAAWVTPRVEREAKQQSREQTPRLVLGSKMGAAKEVAVAWGLK